MFPAKDQGCKEGAKVAEIPRFSDTDIYSTLAAVMAKRRKFVSESPSSFRHCGRILHKRHVAAPGSARAHVPGMTKPGKGGSPFLSSTRYVDRLRKRESDFHVGGMTVSGLAGTSDRPDRIRRCRRFHCRLSRHFDREALWERDSFTWRHSERGAVVRLREELAKYVSIDKTVLSWKRNAAQCGYYVRGTDKKRQYLWRVKWNFPCREGGFLPRYYR